MVSKPSVAWILGPSHDCLGSCHNYCLLQCMTFKIWSPISYLQSSSPTFVSSIDFLLKNKSPYFSISIYKPPNPPNHSSIYHLIISFMQFFAMTFFFYPHVPTFYPPGDIMIYPKILALFQEGHCDNYYIWYFPPISLHFLTTH